MKCLVDSIERSSWTLLSVAQTPLIRSLGRRKLRSEHRKKKTAIHARQRKSFRLYLKQID